MQIYWQTIYNCTIAKRIYGADIEDGIHCDWQQVKIKTIEKFSMVFIFISSLSFLRIQG